jgi:tRNA A37 threonylcarbamoyladenosine dehydratase
MSTSFSYTQAFSRNIGWVTAAEQQVLRGKRVAIAGMGGVGGVHLLTLARLGVGAFHVADFDTFDIANFNRQVGAAVSTLGARRSTS